jgi:hypothetical protein
MSHQDPIQRRKLYQEVLDRLTARIVAGEFACRERLARNLAASLRDINGQAFSNEMQLTNALHGDGQMPACQSGPYRSSISNPKAVSTMPQSIPDILKCLPLAK